MIIVSFLQEVSVSQVLDHGSISFGRFALEPLSWEKRSVFTRNRYQEELKKFNAPGLVAQKKAYFEEYYKRIREIKALQENKHTESASNCSDSSGISEQIKEDQRVIPRSDGNEMINTIGSDVEKTSAELTLDVDRETASVKLNSPATFPIYIKNSGSPPNPKRSQILDINSCLDEPITSIVHIEQHGFMRVDNKLEPRVISGQIGVENQSIIGKKSHGDELDYIVVSNIENASIEVPLVRDVETALLETNPPVERSVENKMGKNSQNSKPFQFLDQNQCDHEPIIASSQDCKQTDFIYQDNEVVPKKTEKYVSNDSSSFLSSPKVLKDKLMPAQKKVNQAVKGFKGSACSSKVMVCSNCFLVFSFCLNECFANRAENVIIFRRCLFNIISVIWIEVYWIVTQVGVDQQASCKLILKNLCLHVTFSLVEAKVSYNVS